MQPAAGFADVEHVPPHALQHWAVFLENRRVAADHHGHRGRSSADRRVQHLDAPLAADLGQTSDQRWCVGGGVDPRPASRQPGQYARLVVQHHPLGLNWPGQRCKHHARRLGNGPRALGPMGPHLAQILSWPPGAPSYTVTLCPASSRQRAMGFPIVPVPMYPTSIYCSEVLLLFVGLPLPSVECCMENPTGEVSPI